MMSRSDMDAARRSISATFDEIIDGERVMRDAGADVRDPGEWMQLKDIMARIERRLLASMPAKDAAE